MRSTMPPSLTQFFLTVVKVQSAIQHLTVAAEAAPLLSAFCSCNKPVFCVRLQNKRYLPKQRRYIFARLHGATCYKTKIFIVNPAQISNLAQQSISRSQRTTLTATHRIIQQPSSGTAGVNRLLCQ